MKLIIIGFWFLALPLTGYSQDMTTQVPTQKTALAKLRIENGKAEFVFSHNRVATLMVEHGEVRRINVGLKPVENTCQPQIQMPNCVFNMALAQVRISLVWTEHPDSSFLGKSLRYKKTNDNQTDEDLEDDFKVENIFTAFMSQKSLPLPALKNEKTYLRCQNDFWLKDFIKSDGSVEFESIASEVMLGNFETDVNENISFTEIYQPRFEKVLDKGWELKSFQKSFGLIQNEDPFVSNQVSHFVLKNQAGENCHVAFTSDSSAITQILLEESFLKMKPETRTPLLKWNLFKGSDLQDGIKNLIDPKSMNQQEVL